MLHRRHTSPKTRTTKDFGYDSKKLSKHCLRNYWPCWCILFGLIIFILFLSSIVMYDYVNKPQVLPPIKVENEYSIANAINDNNNDINNNNNNNINNNDVDTKLYSNCEWRDDTLWGTCFGMRYQKDIKTQKECETKCCELEYQERILNDEDSKKYCVSWQWSHNKGCFFGGIMRLGFESAKTPDWCEPTKPKKWNGKRIKSRDPNNICEWNDNELETQCFGLGPVKEGIKTVDECQQKCCESNIKIDGDNNTPCEIYQFREDKGCFFGKSGNCDKDLVTWFGKRKPYPK